MIEITLDTNALRDIEWIVHGIEGNRYKGDIQKQESIKNAFTQLFELRDNNFIELGVTTQIYSDFWKSGAKLPKHLQKLIGQFVYVVSPSLFKFPLTFPAVFPEKYKFENILSDVFPQSDPSHKKYKKNQLDAWQLYSHLVADRDVFISTDKGLLAKKDILKENWNIDLCSPEEFIDRFSE